MDLVFFVAVNSPTRDMSCLTGKVRLEGQIFLSLSSRATNVLGLV